MQAKFWTDAATGPKGTRMGIYLTILIDNFAKEVIESQETEMVIGWRSKVLHGILCRSFSHISEENIQTDFTVVLRSVLAHSKSGDLDFEDLGPDDFLVVYYANDILSDKCREGIDYFHYQETNIPILIFISAWRSRTAANHGLRWFMRKATLRPIPWRSHSEEIYTRASSDKLYQYIRKFDAKDIFVDPQQTYEDLPHVASDSDSHCESYPISVCNILFYWLNVG